MDREIRPAAVMCQKTYEKILRQVSNWPQQPDVIQHSANSESLLDPKILDRLAALHKFGLGHRAMLLTNGAFLKEQIAEAILRAGVGTLMIGFDGASKEVYEAHRVRCNYERVLTNIRNFARLRDHFKTKLRIIIKYVRTPNNEHEVAAAFKLFGEFLDASLDRFNDALAVDWSEKATSKREIYHVHKVPDRRRLDHCLYFDTDLLIQSDGKVGACCWDYNLQISAGGYGNVDESDLIDIWRSEKRRKLDTAFAQQSAAIPEGCKSCIVIHEIDAIGDLMIIDRDYLESCGSTSFMYQFHVIR